MEVMRHGDPVIASITAAIVKVRGEDGDGWGYFGVIFPFCTIINGSGTI